MRHRSARPTKASSTTSSCRVRSCPKISTRIERRCASWRRRISSYERQMWPREEAKAFFAKRGEPLKVQLIDEKTAGQTRGVVLHDQGPGHLHRLLRRAARAVDRQAEGVQAADARRTRTGRATRSNQPMQRVYGTAFFSDKELKAHLHADRRSEEARPSQARHASSGSSRFIRGRRAPRSGWTRARRSTTRSRTTCARCSSPPATSR